MEALRLMGYRLIVAGAWSHPVALLLLGYGSRHLFYGPPLLQGPTGWGLYLATSGYFNLATDALATLPSTSFSLSSTSDKAPYGKRLQQDGCEASAIFLTRVASPFRGGGIGRHCRLSSGRVKVRSGSIPAYEYPRSPGEVHSPRFSLLHQARHPQSQGIPSAR